MPFGIPQVLGQKTLYARQILCRLSAESSFPFIRWINRGIVKAHKSEFAILPRHAKLSYIPPVSVSVFISFSPALLQFVLTAEPCEQILVLSSDVTPHITKQKTWALVTPDIVSSSLLVNVPTRHTYTWMIIIHMVMTLLKIWMFFS